jgi:hypothetical protein
LPQPIVATADGAGEISLDLLPGRHVGEVASGLRRWPIEVVVPDAPSAALEDCVEGGGGELTPASVLAAQAARDEAQTAADSVVDQLAIVAPLVDAMPDLLSLDASGLSLAEAEIARVGGVIASGDTLALDIHSGAGLLTDVDTVVGSIGQDASGYAPAVILSDGTLAVQRSRVGSQTVTGTQTVTGAAQITGTLTVGGVEMAGADANYEWAIADAAGNPVIGITGGVLRLPDYVVADTLNRAKSASLQSARVQSVQQPAADFNSVILYGQSLAQGNESWPALSTVEQFGNFMLGGDVRPASLSTAGWTQVAPTGLQPLVAKVRENGTGAVLDASAVAALSAGDQARGEVAAIGMVNLASWMIQRRTLYAAQPFVVLCPAVAGMTIEQLSKVNGQDGVDRYSRFTAGLTQAHAAATTGANVGRTHAVTAIVWMQGEYDYSTAYGSTKATKADYKAALAQIRADMIADCKAITGQEEDPIFILYQTGASYTADADSTGAAGLHVGAAQLEFARENPATVALAGPVYPVTDKGGHLDPNGSRWFGQKLGQVYLHTVIEGRRWRPLTPTKIERIAPTRIRLHFHVPVPPLAWDTPYVQTTATDFAEKGFRVTDSAGAVTLAGVDIVGGTMVDLTLGRAVDAASCLVWYAPKTTFNGAGCLTDSDSFLARDSYAYMGGTGQYAAANIPALVGSPYPLKNWACAFALPLGYSE